MKGYTMINNVLKTLSIMFAVSIYTLNTASAKICYLPLADQCDGQPHYEASAARVPQAPKFEPKPEEPEEEFFCQGFDLDAPLGKDYACSDCSDSLGIHYRCHLICNPDKCGEDEVFNSQTCMCDEISDTCKKYMHKFKAVAYAPMSSSECSEAKDDLGLDRCVSSGNDYYAGAVMACGGTDNVITAEEAEELAYCMYNPTESYSSIYGDRYDGFLKSYNADTGDHVFVWVNWEGGNADEHGAIVRMYDTYGSIPYYAERSGSMYYIDEDIENVWENASILSQTLCRT
jgi:hypothetical protein